MAAAAARSFDHETGTERGNKPKQAPGVEAYPYDPLLRPGTQRGLDRALAAMLYELFQVAERNTSEAAAAARQHARVCEQLRQLASRALEGALGPKASELARAALLDERGARINDERALRHFARAFRELQRLDAVANEASAQDHGEA
jgi:glycine/D-amino acid oxidase-like deaminating enzyme